MMLILLRNMLHHVFEAPVVLVEWSISVFISLKFSASLMIYSVWWVRFHVVTLSLWGWTDEVYFCSVYCLLFLSSFMIQKSALSWSHSLSICPQYPCRDLKAGLVWLCWNSPKSKEKAGGQYKLKSSEKSAHFSKLALHCTVDKLLPSVGIACALFCVQWIP